MEDILDSVRRIVSRWVDTVTPITFDVTAGDLILTVGSTNRFQVGDEVMIESPQESEVYLTVDEIIDNQNIALSTAVQNDWDSDEGIVLRKLLNGMYINGIYIGEPQVIPRYPAITVNGRTISSEWMTLDSTKEKYDVEIAIYVEAGTQEDGYRFLLNMQKTVVDGLKRNIFPLVNDYDSTSIQSDVQNGDAYITVADASVFNTPLTDTTGGYPRLSDARAILEDKWNSEETRVQRIISPTVIEIAPLACRSYSTSDNPIIIRPKRFIYNSWPHTVDIGTIDKGSLLQAAVIRWFAEEEELVDFKNNDPHLK